MAASLGAAATAKQAEKIRDYKARGEEPPKLLLPAGKASVLIVSSLVVGSAVYHTVIFSRIGF